MHHCVDSNNCRPVPLVGNSWPTRALFASLPSLRVGATSATPSGHLPSCRHDPLSSEQHCGSESVESFPGTLAFLPSAAIGHWRGPFRVGLGGIRHPRDRHTLPNYVGSHRRSLLCGIGRFIHVGTARSGPTRARHQAERPSPMHAFVGQLPLGHRPSPRAHSARCELRWSHDPGSDSIPGPRNPGPAVCAPFVHFVGLHRNRRERSWLLDHRHQLCGRHAVGHHQGRMELQIALHRAWCRSVERGRPQGRFQGGIVAQGDQIPVPACQGVRHRLSRYLPPERVGLLADAPVFGARP